MGAAARRYHRDVRPLWRILPYRPHAGSPASSLRRRRAHRLLCLGRTDRSDRGDRRRQQLLYEEQWPPEGVAPAIREVESRRQRRIRRRPQRGAAQRRRGLRPHARRAAHAARLQQPAVPGSCHGSPAVISVPASRLVVADHVARLRQSFLRTQRQSESRADRPHDSQPRRRLSAAPLAQGELHARRRLLRRHADDRIRTHGERFPEGPRAAHDRGTSADRPQSRRDGDAQLQRQPRRYGDARPEPE